MRCTSLAVPLFALCLLAGCSSSSPQQGASGLGNIAGSAAPSAPHTGTPTTAPPTTKPTTANPTTAKPVANWPSPADCVSYNPNTVTVDGSGATGTFVLTSGSTVVMRLHGQSDDVGQQALALAQTYTEHCYIGRNNTREEKGDYIFDYWRNPSGQHPTIPDLEDACSQYNNKNLTVEDMGEGDGWRVKDHDHVLHIFDNGTDARNGNVVLLKYGQICSIGDSEDNDSDLGQVTFLEP